MVCPDCGAENSFRVDLCQCGRFLVTDRPLQYQRDRNQLGWVVAIFVIAATFIFGGMVLPFYDRFAHAQTRQAESDVRTLDTIAQRWAIAHPGSPCPTLEELRAAGEIPKSSKLTDPWDKPYVVECDGTAVQVRSAGPDAKLKTPDDITSRPDI